MKFTMAIEKKNKVSIGRSEGHNTRLHNTTSQLPQSAWLTPKGCHSVADWRAEQIEVAKGLAKRKDAVVAIELVVQVGDQTDWREMPTPEHPYGRPRPGMKKMMGQLGEAAMEAAKREFGAENIVGVTLHTDESSPHVHIVVTPIKDGKLQAKAWLDGPQKCAALRERIWEVVSHQIDCDYERGAPGGAPHDPGKAAGGAKARQPQGVIAAVKDLVKQSAVVTALRDEVKALKQQLQMQFSRTKKLERDVDKAKEKAKEAELRAQASERYEKQSRERIAQLEAKIEQLQPKPKPAPAPAPSPVADRGPSGPR